MGILPMIHGQNAHATQKEYVNLFAGHSTSGREDYTEHLTSASYGHGGGAGPPLNR